MLLVVFGAGASFDSADPNLLDFNRKNRSLQWRPPLAQQLFDPQRPNFGKAIDTFPACRGLVVDLRRALRQEGRLLERELDLVAERARTDPPEATSLMALRYYLRGIISECRNEWWNLVNGCTNYHSLVRRLDRWSRLNNEGVLYVTFNYDTLLEGALEDVLHLQFNELFDYGAAPFAKVFKLHGSTNWAHQVKFDVISDISERDYVIRNAHDISIPAEIYMVPNQDVGTRGQAWVPALAVPIENKGEFVCPAKHISTLDTSLQYVDRLLVIGWRATEQHFLKMLVQPSNFKSVLVACAGEEASQETANRISDARGGLSVLGYTNWQSTLGFSDLVGSKELEDFLA